ncbi:Uncharacterised protein [Mycobacteroides abscessus subsp. abscessus]|uniref:hypothetical protein n=1 Tax=Mycobacteroides abscessus TaxID=36809 RepID=UPI000929F548|nr:hypothetical protein [Mycobacteroides abscessus]SHS19411.1 Uncharacterised protein [Mycobacteroides abscessus subsp. abscessus]
MADQMMIDFEPEVTAARQAATAERDAAFDALVVTGELTIAEAREQGLWFNGDDKDRVALLVCPACADYEPNELLMSSNHGINRFHIAKQPDGTWANAGRYYGRDWCLALELTSTHARRGLHTLHSSQTRMIERLRPEIRAQFDKLATPSGAQGENMEANTEEQGG